MKSSTELLADISPFSTAPCNGVVVGNFWLSSGDVLPPLEMRFCNSLFTASSLDPYSSWFPSDVHRSCKYVGRLTALKWREKKDGQVASISLSSLQQQKFLSALWPCSGMWEGAEVLRGLWCQRAVCCGEGCPFAPSECLGSAPRAPETRPCLWQADKGRLRVVRAGCRSRSERRVVFLSYLESWTGMKQSFLENADFLPFVKINSPN